MSFWEQMAKTIDASEEKQKKEDLYQKTFHELAEKLSEIRNKETADKTEAHGHVAGAINFPIEKITEERVCRRLPDKTTGLYIIGSYYHKPNVAMKKFKKLGYKNLHFSGFMEEHHGMLTR